ncbi:cyclin-like F-box domain containing protein [Rhodotorula toruloides]|uniref:Cyclin-like F-box domain containing protein n=1 Tax=Rhodotorula toruloides TaxID=5286 RepID=A0A511KG15_RHOTO|nr:cyclin-like F-box domain containing protein [Rhodotorula toruloides]
MKTQSKPDYAGVCASVSSKLTENTSSCNSWTWYDAARLVDQPVRLTDAIWESISDRVVAAVDTSRRERLVSAAEKQLRERQADVEQLYTALRHCQGCDYPAFPDFALLPYVKPLSVRDDAQSPDGLNNGLNNVLKSEIAADVSEAKLIVKRGFASSLAHAYESQGVAMDGMLAAKLKALPPTRVAADVKLTTEFGDSALSLVAQCWAPNQALNFEAYKDSAVDLEADVDALRRRFTSLVVEHFTLVHEVLQETSLPNLVGSIDTLDKSDWRLDCRDCKSSPSTWYTRGWTGFKNMTWSNFVRLALPSALSLSPNHASRVPAAAHISRDHKLDASPDMRIFRKGQSQPQTASTSSPP